MIFFVQYNRQQVYFAMRYQSEYLKFRDYVMARHNYVRELRSQMKLHVLMKIHYSHAR